MPKFVEKTHYMNTKQVKYFIHQFYFLLSSSTLLAWSSLSIHSKPTYKESSSHLSYADPQAAKGGSLHFAVEGSYDTLNPYTAKGKPSPLMNLVFQTLGQKVLDEVDTVYPQIAEDFLVSKDGLSMRVKLYKDAQFSDGHPLRSEDVLFSFETLQSKDAAPFYKLYWSDILSAKVLSPSEIEFRFKRKSKELPLLVADLPVLPKHFYGKGSFSVNFINRALGSGPYVVESFKMGSFLTFKKNNAFWNRDHLFNRGRYNFDKIVQEMFHDPVALLENFKKGNLDFIPVYKMKYWMHDLAGMKFDRNWILKETWPQKMNQGGYGFYFNLRKPIFRDLNVRKAISLIFDFPWTNKSLFYGAYKENYSIFANSEYEAKDLPSRDEIKWLKDLKNKFPREVPEEVLLKPIGELSKTPSLKERFEKAARLLKNADYSRDKKGLLKGPGGMLSFRILIRNISDMRFIESFKNNLRQVGIELNVELKDSTLFTRKLLDRDFDMVLLNFPSSISPGQEQKGQWHSSSALEKDSRNHSGLKNHAIDELLDRLGQAGTYKEVLLASHCLDRLLYHLHVKVPAWYSDHYYVAYWNKFRRPSVFPLYYFESEFLEFMWVDKAMEIRLEKAKMLGESF